MIIYKITNKINSKIYIGQTIRSIEERWKEHAEKGSALYRAIHKYGKENFTIEQIDVAVNRDELDEKEKYWIKHYDSTNKKKGYNLTSGGEHFEIPEERRIRMSEIEQGEKNHFYGKHHSDETKRRISEAKKGKHVGENNPNYGKKHSEEIRKKISEQLKSFYAENGHSSLGKHHSEETKQKIRDFHKGRWVGGKSPRAKKVLCVETGEVFNSLVEAAESINRKVSSLHSAVSGRSNRCGGYHWQYIDN